MEAGTALEIVEKSQTVTHRLVTLLTIYLAEDIQQKLVVNAPRVMENIGAMETANGIRVSAYMDVSLEIVL